MIRFSLLFLVFSALIAMSARAQVDPGACEACYRNRTYDSAFYLGGHIVRVVSDGVDTFLPAVVSLRLDELSVGEFTAIRAATDVSLCAVSTTLYLPACQ